MYVLDIGGEGRHRKAWNLNPSHVKTLGPNRGRPIPRLIVGRGETIPLPDASVDCVIVERTPLRMATVREIARVVVPCGTVVLRHVRLPHIDPHEPARQILCGALNRCRLTKRNGQPIQETVIRIDGIRRGSTWTQLPRQSPTLASRDVQS